jgi:hypothetical protein
MIVPRHFLACLPMCGALLLLTGCGYVHFRPAPRRRPRDDRRSTMLAENSDLRLEKTILQRELALARKEGHRAPRRTSRTATRTPAPPRPTSSTRLN